MKRHIKPGYNNFFNTDNIFCINVVGKPYGIQVQILTKREIIDLGIIDPQAGYCEIKGVVPRQRAKG
mgnify:CR=1 FL=1